MYGFDHGAWMFGGWLMMLVFWLLPFLAVFAGIKYLLSRQDPPTAAKSALDILDEAYAAGKISREEYLQKRDDLQKK